MIALIASLSIACTRTTAQRNEMKMPEHRLMNGDYLGSLTNAPKPFLRSVGDLPVVKLLTKSEWGRGCYVPAFDSDSSIAIGVLFEPFRGQPTDPWSWQLVTVGLSAIEQGPPRVPGHRPFSRIELVASFFEPADWGEFRRTWERGALAAAPSVPAAVHRFALVAREVGKTISIERDAFAIGDPITNLSFAEDFPSSVLIPPVFDLLWRGVRPFYVDGTGQPIVSDIAWGDWLNPEVLHQSGDHGFVQLAPLLAEEDEIARRDGGFNYFLHGLLATDSELAAGKNADDHIRNLSRSSRVRVFEAAKSRLGDRRTSPRSEGGDQ